MKVLFIADEFYGWCHRYILAALQRQTERADLFLTRSFLPTAGRLLKRKALKALSLTFKPAYRVAADAESRRVNARLLGLTDLDRYDVLLFVERGDILPETFAALRRKTGAVFVSWLGDSLYKNELMNRYAASYADYMDFLFFPDEDWCREVGGRSFFLPYGADLDTFMPVTLDAAERERLSSDVCQVGVMNRMRVACIRAIREDGWRVGVWGASQYRWTRRFSATIPKDLRENIRGGIIMPDEACKVYSSARLVLNVHAPQFSTWGINNRVFEVGAAGAFQLIDFRRQLSAHNEGIEDLIWFKSFSDLKEKVRYFMSHEAERRQIAEAFRKTVETYHTYDCRVKVLLDIVREHRGRKK